MGNRPVVGVDPDGKLFFIPILVGAAIGGLINVGIQAATGGIDFNKAGWGWDVAASFGIGAAAGAASVIAPQLIGTLGGIGLTTSTGAVAGGFVPGLVAGSAGGFVGGFANSMALGYDNSRTFAGNLITSLGEGLKGAAIGGVAGGLIGGGLNLLRGKPFLGEKVSNLPWYQRVREPNGDGTFRHRWRNINDPGIKTQTISIVRGSDVTDFDQINLKAIDVTEPGSKSTNYLIRDKSANEVWRWITEGTNGSANKSGTGLEYFVRGGTRQQGYVWSYYTSTSTQGASISYGFNGLKNPAGRIFTRWYYKFRFNY